MYCFAAPSCAFPAWRSDRCRPLIEFRLIRALAGQAAARVTGGPSPDRRVAKPVVEFKDCRRRRNRWLKHRFQLAGVELQRAAELRRNADLGEIAQGSAAGWRRQMLRNWSNIWRTAPSPARTPAWPEVAVGQAEPQLPPVRIGCRRISLRPIRSRWCRVRHGQGCGRGGFPPSGRSGDALDGVGHVVAGAGARCR